MNRREAIALLTSVPAITSISRADLKPTDVLVVECEGCVSVETAARITEYIKQVWPNHKAIVLGDGLKLRVVRGHEVGVTRGTSHS